METARAWFFFRSPTLLRIRTGWLMFLIYIYPIIQGVSTAISLVRVKMGPTVMSIIKHQTHTQSTTTLYMLRTPLLFLVNFLPLQKFNQQVH